MKKNKLYTANRWNQPAFMSERNLFPEGGALAGFDRAASAEYGANYGNEGFTLNDYMNSKNAFGISKADNPFSKGNLAGGLGAMAKTPIGGALVSGLAGTVGKIGGNLISGGLESGAGNAIGSIGSTVGSAISTVNPLLGGIVSAGSGILGGLANAAFGIKENTALKKEVEEGINRNKNFVSNAGSFDDVKGPVAATTNTNVYEGGWFSGGKARRKNEELKRRMIDAKTWANRSVDNNIFNLQSDQMNDALANFSAFGGPLDYYSNDNMSAVNYGFMSDYLTQKKKQTEQKNNMSNLFAGMPNGLFADGGYMTEQEAEKAAADSFHNNVIWNSNLPFGLKGYSTLGKETFNNMLGNIQQSATPYAFGGDMQTNGADYSVGKVYNVSEKEANRLKAMGYEFTVVG